MASAPRSPVRTRTTVSTGRTQTFPSPILPGGRRRTMASTTVVRLGVVDEHLDPELGDEVHLVLRPPVDLGVPSLAAEPLGLGQGHPLDPEVFRASFTSSSLNGFRTATISFM